MNFMISLIALTTTIIAGLFIIWTYAIVQGVKESKKKTKKCRCTPKKGEVK